MVCHAGGGTEAGSGALYVKFGAARTGAHAPEYFGRLLASCETFAGERGYAHMLAGVNSARLGAYRQMLDLGFRTAFTGVAMQRPAEPGYNRPDCFVIDDWG